MESPVVLDKPPEYHGNSDRGFPFEEEEGSGAWSELAARHPDIAARLRQRPATWARKRRPSSQDATDDFGESFTGFDRFPFDDIPPEFREHFPSHWGRRYSEREQPPPDTPAQHAQHAQHAPPAPPPQHHTAATQTEHEHPPHQEHTLPQYGLRNTVDLGQKSPADPSVDAEDRAQRSMSAPPDAPRTPNMSSNHQQEAHAPPNEHHSNVRHIPIFVEGRDEPVINKNVDHGTHFGETKPAAHQPPPAPQPHVDRDAYFADDGPVGFHHPPNFTRAFGTPFNKGFRQGPQPFVQQKAYPQSAFTRGASPQRAQSPLREEHFVKVPVQHEQAPPRPESARAHHKPPPPAKQPSPQRQQPPPAPAPAAAPRDPTPPPRQTTPADPITQILSIQTDVLNLMTEVENFAGTKKDKRYLFLDEMLTRNLIKLDNIETEGKENIRQARKEAIKCIQKCIAVLEAKADSNGAKAALAQQPPQDIDMNESSEPAADAQSVPEMQPATENGEVEMKEAPKMEEVESQPERIEETQPPKEEIKEEPKREATPKPQEQTQKVETHAVPAEPTEPQNPAADTRPDEHKPKPEDKAEEQKKEVENKPSPKKKVVKKRDKSKEAAKDCPSDTNTEAPKDNKTDEVSKDSNKTEVAQESVVVMQVDEKGEKPMEVDGAASQ